MRVGNGKASVTNRATPISVSEEPVASPPLGLALPTLRLGSNLRLHPE